MSLAIAVPAPGEHVSLAEARSYRVRVTLDAVGPDVIGLELALDAGRPRRVSLAEPTLTLAELLSADLELSSGAHWLFAAPISGAGLVPRSAAGGSSSAKARRFFIGNAPDDPAGASGAVWLRKPDGSYNGVKHSQALLFEAFVFSALGTALDTPSTIRLQSHAISGQLQLDSPFIVRDVPSGVYEVSASAKGASASSTRFTVNRELSEGP